MAEEMVAEPPKVHKELGATCTLGAAGNGKQIAGNQMRYGVGELVFRSYLKPYTTKDTKVHEEKPLVWFVELGDLVSDSQDSGRPISQW